MSDSNANKFQGEREIEAATNAFLTDYHGFLEIIKEDLSKIDPFEIHLLKCHVILQKQLESFIELNTATPINLTNKYFSDIYTIAKAVGAFSWKGYTPMDKIRDNFIPSLTKARNEVGHQEGLSPERKANLLNEARQVLDIFAKPDDSEIDIVTKAVTLASTMLRHSYLIAKQQSDEYLKFLAEKKKT